MDPLIWSGLLFFVGIVFIFGEVFLPTGGLLGFLAVVALIASVAIAFVYRGPEFGLAVVIITMIAVPVTLTMAFRYWPHTPMGRRLLLGVPKSDDLLPDSPQRQRLRQLVGKFGVAKSVMMPSGAVLVEGQVIDAMSNGQAIEAGQPIQIVEVRGTHVLVRPVEKSDLPATSTDDPLNQTIESLGIESLDDPLA